MKRTPSGFYLPEPDDIEADRRYVANIVKAFYILRNQTGVNQRDFGREVGRSQSRVSEEERDNQNPYFTTIQQRARNHGFEAYVLLIDHRDPATRILIPRVELGDYL